MMPSARPRPGWTWDDFEYVLSRTSVFETDADAMRPWAGPPGQAWLFWSTVAEARRKQTPRAED